MSRVLRDPAVVASGVTAASFRLTEVRAVCLSLRFFRSTSVPLLQAVAPDVAGACAPLSQALAAVSLAEVLVADGKRVRHIELTLPRADNAAAADDAHGGANAPSDGSQPVPQTITGDPARSFLIPHHQHASAVRAMAVQALPSGGAVVVASADGLGRTKLSHHSLDSPDFSASSAWSCSPPSCLAPGVTRLSFVPGSSGSQFVVSTFFPKQVHYFAEDRLQRTIHTVCEPTDTAFMPEGSEAGRVPLMLVAEGSQVSIWDVQRGGCVTRFSAGPTPVMSVAGTATAVGSAGFERCVNVYDPRKWRPIGTWKSALKYEVGALYFSTQNEHLCFAAAMSDSEIAAGSWCTTVPQESRLDSTSRFRADSRWIGTSRVAGTDSFLGLTSQGSLYVLEEFCTHVSGALQGEQVTDARPAVKPDGPANKAKAKAKRSRKGRKADADDSAETETDQQKPFKKRARPSSEQH